MFVTTLILFIVDGCDICFCGMGISQSPSEWLQYPCKISSKFLNIRRNFLFNKMSQPSSANMPSESNEVERFGINVERLR